MHIPIRSLLIRTDYDLTTVYESTLHYFAKSVVGEKKKRMPGKSINQRKTRQYRAYQNREKFMIRVFSSATVMFNGCREGRIFIEFFEK